PAYMMPARFQYLDQLPLTGNGKVDHAALLRLQATATPADTDRSGPEVSRVESSSGPTDARAQRFLNDIREVLGSAAQDTTKSLIELGASSLEIVRISNLARSYVQSRLRLEDYFAAPSIDALLEKIAPERAQAQAQARVISDRTSDRERRAMPLQTDLGAADSHACIGVRQDLDGTAAVQLIRQPEKEPEQALRARRRTHRQYSLRPIRLRTLSQWLQPLASFQEQETSRYRYASPGGLYPVQVYLHVKQGRVQGLLGGNYYYHPAQHRLVEVAPAFVLDRDAYGDQNRPAFDEAALCVFLVCPIQALERFYGEWG